MTLHHASRTCRAVRLQGTGRADFRLRGVDDGTIFAVELFARESLLSRAAEPVGLLVVDQLGTVKQLAITLAVDVR